MNKTKAALFADNVPWHADDIVEYVYGSERLKLIEGLCVMHPRRITTANLAQELTHLRDIEAIFSCWGMPLLSDDQINQMPSLKAIFYASGSVQEFAKPYMERGITICSAASANAIPVAEFCLAQILLSCKGVYRNSVFCRRGPWKKNEMPVGLGVYGETLAILGVGAISRHLLTLLAPFNLRVIAVSGFLSEAEAKELGIDALVDLKTAFREAYIVSNHLADKPANRGILTTQLFASMRPGATFINTGRGAQVDEAGLVQVMKARPDLTALLDVQYPEPPEAGSELYTLPNIHMTSHIAGSANHEVHRMADCMIEDFKRWSTGQSLHFQVDPGSLATRA